MDDLKTILDRIRKPLAFASRDDFAHLKSLADPGLFIKKQIDDLKHVTKDKNIDSLREFENLFSDFDRLAPELKKERIRKASQMLDAFENAHWQSTHPSASPPPEPALIRSSPESPHLASLKPDTPIQYCKGIGPKRAGLLNKIGIVTVEDALFYLPWRYEDRGNLMKIGRLSYGSYETVSGKVVSAEVASDQEAAGKDL